MLQRPVMTTLCPWLALALLTAPPARADGSAAVAAVAAAPDRGTPTAASEAAPDRGSLPATTETREVAPKRRLSLFGGPTATTGPKARRGLSWSRADDPVPERRFLLGVEGVVVQAPPLRPEIVRFDPRFLGRSVSLGGLGLLGRLQVHPRIAVETTVRSGSVRYAGREDEDKSIVSQDQVMADLGVLLYVARGDVAQIAFDAGMGGMGTRVVYELEREGTQLFGSGLVRVGVDAEFLFKRIAFVVSVRSYGVFTDRDRSSLRGALLAGKTLLAPVATFQTFLVASGGIAYRF
jgi:hypothetical protein